MADPNEFAFILDSGTPVPKKFSQDLSDYGIQVETVPFKITFEKPVFDKTDYFDNVDISGLDFYNMMKDYEQATNGSRPTTTQPSPGDFEQVYSQLRENGAKHLIALPILKEHSGTYNSAVLAS